MPELTPLAFSALGLLSEGPMHPYEMFQTMIARGDDRNVKVRPGTLYHQVGRLTELGYAVEAGTEREGNRPERTRYAITDAGRDVLRDALFRMVSLPAEEYPSFHLAMSELENLAAADAVRALERRIGALLADRARYQDDIDGVRGRELAERYWLDVSYVHAMLAAQIEWLRVLVDRIRSGDLPWTGPAVPHDSPAIGTPAAGPVITTKEPTR
ncbi:PadR family transcriptional regulator [Curtobacterium sp. Leaf261]|uniref:PadR family transcriptional regulator n=1 Tax=Curtobacterium sp. Leaf261 TaxID=1736311 RepID=UPI000AD5345F|nr:PadR family transcriptional regulator [Curtobacterium sp. Leaf261]